MNLELRTHALVRVLLDFDLTLEFSDGSTVAFSELTVDGELVDEDNQFEGLRLLSALIGTACVSAEIDENGTVQIEFEGGAVVVAEPRAEVESWEYTDPDGATSVCLAGGVVETWPPAAPGSRRETRSPARFPSLESTVVRISVGTGAAVEFSDGSALATEVSLDEAYLVLRESVVAVDEAGVKLASGYVFGIS
ncbi:DUF6188 family protein [Rhodococcoides yunnanense]|uniref:DUF6188 family protein n=1 Tax=Rhodococcoides yunnanense TaxID=278209 RepID=UPI000932EB46|nr:DUF6188 family protein [Rhodococcus yunnanensis]